MHKTVYAFGVRIFCRIKRSFQPSDFAVHNFFIVHAAGFLFKKPAARAAQGCVSVHMAVIMDKIYTRYTVRGKKTLHFGSSFPPQIVIALYKKLTSRQVVEKPKVGKRLLEADPPGQVAGNDEGILLAQAGKIRFQLVQITVLRAAEDIHGFICAKGEMKVRYRI